MALTPDQRGVAYPSALDATVVRGRTVTGKEQSLYVPGFQPPKDAQTAIQLSEHYLALGSEYPPRSVGEDIALRRALRLADAAQALSQNGR